MVTTPPRPASRLLYVDWLRGLAVLVWPFLPGTAERMWRDLGLEGSPAGPVHDGWDLLAPGAPLSPSGPLFPRIEG